MELWTGVFRVPVSLMLPTSSLTGWNKDASVVVVVVLYSPCSAEQRSEDLYIDARKLVLLFFIVLLLGIQLLIAGGFL